MIKRIQLINGLAAFVAVLHHSTHWVVTAMVYWADRYRPVSVPNFDFVGSYSFYFTSLVDQLVLFGVPAFLFISGYFVTFATGIKQQTIQWSVVFNRIRVLIPPYLLWSLIIIGLNIMQGQEYGLAELASMILTGGVVAPYYYVPLLIQLYLISPFLVPLVRQHWKLVLFASVLLKLLSSFFIYTILLDKRIPGIGFLYTLAVDWHVPANIIWFVLGMVVGFNLRAFKEMLRRMAKWLPVLLLLTLPVTLVEWDLLRRSAGREWISPQSTFFGSILILVIILGLFSYEKLYLRIAPQLEFISEKSFGIYLIHVLVLEVTARVIYHLAPWLLGVPLLFQFILVVFGLGIPLLVMEIVDRTPARHFYKLAFG
ncbi:MAG TPA: acyltransferase [Anaerolineales bacterium]|nr:acyltransferase [Anaerolineales bacterium]